MKKGNGLSERRDKDGERGRRKGEAYEQLDENEDDNGRWMEQ
jgi:hypothetical protein